MTNTIGTFGYTISQIDDKGKLPFDPFVVIDLNSWTRDATDSPVISPTLMSDGEIDEQIKQLKADLDAVGAKAKRALKQAQQKTLAIVSARTSN